MTIKVGLSTSSVYPDNAATGFVTAARLGYDAVEVMVWTDPVTQEAGALRALSEHHGIPVVSVHAPTLLVTQGIWGEPWEKVDRSIELALAVGASTVVLHPPFRWQREYADEFVDGVALREHESGVRLAVENMYPWRAPRREMEVYVPGWDPSEHDYANATLDLSHSSVSRSDPVEMARRLGPRLRHIHMTDGTGSAKDEHLVPGRGTQPAAELLEHLADGSFAGHVVIEINTRKAGSRQLRELDLMEALAFTRLNFASAPDPR